MPEPAYDRDRFGLLMMAHTLNTLTLTHLHPHTHTHTASFSREVADDRWGHAATVLLT
jgi:hypothetical protein